MTNLGVMYETGRGGLPKDDAQAVSWYRKAADAGDARAMASLGAMYETGRGACRRMTPRQSAGIAKRHNSAILRPNKR